jgi:biotin carboxylase
MILAARRLGFHVVTSGNHPDAPGHQYSDQVELCDYSDSNALLSLARKIRPVAVCPACNDFAALSAARIALELGLPGHDHPHTVEILHHKDRWREFALREGIPSPRAIGCQSLIEAEAACEKLTFPLLVKPVDLTGGRGISRIETPHRAGEQIRHALKISKAERIVVEEFVEGTRHGFTCILRNQRPAFWMADDEHYHLSPWLVSGASTPSALPASAVSELLALVEKIGNRLRLVDGIFHMQLILTPQQKPVIVEVCRRPPGDLYVDLVRHAAGVPYADWIVKGFAGMDLSDVQPVTAPEPVTRHCLMAAQPGILESFEFNPAIGSLIREEMIWGQPGTLVEDAERHKFGIVFLFYSSPVHMQSVVPDLQKLLLCRTKSVAPENTPHT